MQQYKVTVNGKVFEVTVETTGENTAQSQSAAASAPKAVQAPAPAPIIKGTVGAGDTAIPAPLAGTILSIMVKPGETVKQGQVLLTLEALKMENELVAPSSGVVKDIFISVGTTVNVGDTLMTLRSS